MRKPRRRRVPTWRKALKIYESGKLRFGYQTSCAEKDNLKHGKWGEAGSDLGRRQGLF